jgi:hypothetical protein
MKVHSILVGGVVLTALFTASIPLPASVGTLTAHQSNITATLTPTPDPARAIGACSNPRRPQMSQARLYAPQSRITADHPGRIVGQFSLEDESQCPVKVRIVVRLASGVTIVGDYYNPASGAGVPFFNFILQPSTSVNFSANVYSRRAGQFSIGANVVYYPVGHPELQNEVDGILMNFTATEPVTEPPPLTPTPESHPPGLPAFVLAGAGIIALSVALAVGSLVFNN